MESADNVIGYLLLIDNSNNLIDVLKYNKCRYLLDSDFPYRARAKYIIYCEDIEHINKIENIVNHIMNLHATGSQIEKLTKIKFRYINQ